MQPLLQSAMMDTALDPTAERSFTMAKQSIRTRLTASFSFIIAITLMLFGVYVLNLFYEQSVTSMRETLEIHAKHTEYQLRQLSRNFSATEQLPELVRQIGGSLQLDFDLIDRQGRVIAQSNYEAPVIHDSQADWPEVRTAFTGAMGNSIRPNPLTGENTFFVAVPAGLEHPHQFALRVSAPMVSVDSGFRHVRGALLIAILVTSIVSLLISFNLARHLTSPLETITAVAANFAKGDLSRRIHIRSGGEFDLLANTLNNLAANLHDKIREARTEQRKLELILEHMDNAVILFDRYGHVTTANRKADELFGMKAPLLGKHNLQVIGSGNLDHIVQVALSEHRARMIDLKTSLNNTKRVFQVFVAPLYDAPYSQKASGVLCVFHDITLLKELQERQTEFVGNASHELATPLTAIRGFAETLLDGAAEDEALRTKFLTIIHTEADRMQRLINDLLQLARLDSSDYRQQINITEIDASGLLETIREELSHFAERKRLTLAVSYEQPPAKLLANRDWLKQAILNLVENAIKYSLDGGAVTLSYRQDEQFAYFSVIDAGPGIPEKDLPLIFDRFYRVDKARSRADGGGTGLGLSIVKFIVEMFGGTIKATSRVGAGTNFTFSVPRAPVK